MHNQFDNKTEQKITFMKSNLLNNINWKQTNNKNIEALWLYGCAL